MSGLYNKVPASTGCAILEYNSNLIMNHLYYDQRMFFYMHLIKHGIVFTITDTANIQNLRGGETLMIGGVGRMNEMQTTNISI